jgi:PASTA domain
MSKGRSPWQDGRRAWERLAGWLRRTRSPDAPESDDGKGALAALADVGLLRRLLDQAEMAAVRDARQHGKSWAEIAVTLGITRQSAWERWRDLDDADAAEPALSGMQQSTTPVAPADSSVAENRPPRFGRVPEIVERAAAEVVRRRTRVLVPNVIGMSWDEARGALVAKRLVAVGPDPDAPPLTALGWPDAVVTDQSPESGARVPIGSAITLWVERRGGSGVREPRRPKPAPRAARGALDEPSGEAVG